MPTKRSKSFFRSTKCTIRKIRRGRLDPFTLRQFKEGFSYDKEEEGNLKLGQISFFRERSELFLLLRLQNTHVIAN